MAPSLEFLRKFDAIERIEIPRHFFQLRLQNHSLSYFHAWKLLTGEWTKAV